MEVKPVLELIAVEFRSGNSVPVERATFTRERMQEVLEAHCLNETLGLRSLLREALGKLSLSVLAWNELEQRYFAERMINETWDLYGRIERELGDS